MWDEFREGGQGDMAAVLLFPGLELPRNEAVTNSAFGMKGVEPKIERQPKVRDPAASLLTPWQGII